MARLVVSLFGPFEAILDGALITAFESAKVRALLAYLAAESDRPQRREALAALLWPDWPQQSAMSNLRNALVDLRKNIGDRDAQPPFLLISRESIQLNREADVWVDVGEFEQGIKNKGEGIRGIDQGIGGKGQRFQSTINNLQSAISLYRGSFLEGFSISDSPAFDQWALARREGLQRQALQALFMLAEAHEQQGELEKAIPYARRQVELEPWHEPGQQQLMRLLALSGLRSAALAQYEACRQALADELKVEPSVETKRLVEAIRDENIDGIKGKGIGVPPIPYPLTPAVLPPAPGEAPFKGLQYFDVGDAGLFFGREALTARLVGHIRQMVEVGAVGVGLVQGANHSDRRTTDLPLRLAGEDVPPDRARVGGDGSTLQEDQEVVGASRSDIHGSLIDREGSPLPEGCCFLAVVGASGSGKSSVVRAGVVPALQKGEGLADGTLPPEGSPGWHIHVFTPTAHPLEALAVSLTRENKSVNDTTLLMDDLGRDPRNLHMYALKTLDPAPLPPGEGLGVRDRGKCRLLLVVDQFEELFTLCRSETERTAFLDTLLTAVQGGGPTQVIVVLRADFYGHCAQYPLLRQALCSRQEYIGPMEASELRRAIEEPAKRNGWEFEAGLVDLILRDIGASEDHPPEPGALPLLEHALLETWQRRSGRTLTLQGYADAGGVQGAIAKTAESVFTFLTPEQQVLARRIFLRLTELGEGTQDTRRRAPLEELSPHPGDAPQVESLLKILADARLITLSEDTAEVAHEALIREWPALRQWLSEDREGLHLHRRLTEAAETWAELEHDPGELYRGARLAQAAEWADGHPDELNALEDEFLQASQAQVERDEAEREAQRQRELEAARQVAQSARSLARTQRQRSLVLSVGLLIAIALGVISFSFYRQSNKNLVIARAANTQVAVNAVIARGSQALAQARVLHLDSTLNIIQSGLLTAEGLQHAPGLVGDGTFARVFNKLGFPVTRMAHERSVKVVAFSPDGRWVVSGSDDGTARVWDAVTGQEVARMPHNGIVVNDVVFSPDGLWVVSGSADHTVRIWEAATGKEVVTMKHEKTVNSVAFSPDGRRVVSGSDDGTARVWDIVTGQEVARMPHNGIVNDVAFSPDGRWVVSGGEDGTARVWDAETGKEITRIKHGGSVNAVAFSPDGRTVVSGSTDYTAIVWEAATGKEVARMTHDGSVVAVAFSPDGRWVVSGSSDKTARVWEAATGKEVARMRHDGSVVAVAFSPDGRWVATGSYDYTARVWVAATGVEVSRMFYGSIVIAVAFNPDGRWVVTGSYDCTVTVWAPVIGTELSFMPHDNIVNSVAFSPDGRWVATRSPSRAAHIWDAATGKEIARLPHDGIVYSLAFSPEGSRIVSGSADGAVIVWEATTGKEIIRMTHGGIVRAVAFSPDGNRIVSGSADGTAIVWDTATGKEITRKTHDRNVTAVAFSPNGKFVVSGSADGAAIVWDASTGKEINRRTHIFYVTVVAYSPNGHWIVSGSADGAAIVWEAATGREIAHTIHDGGVNSVAFSPDGRWVVSGGEDGTARVWEAATGKEIAHSTHDGGVNSVAFSPDGRWVVSGGEDGTARVWEAATGKEAYRMTHDGAVNAVAFSPDGHWLVSGSDDYTARVWAWQPQDLVTELCARLPRNFTLEEWQLYFGDVPYHKTCENLP